MNAQRRASSMGGSPIPQRFHQEKGGVRVMATIGVVSSALSDQEHQVQLRRAVMSMEWARFTTKAVAASVAN